TGRTAPLAPVENPDILATVGRHTTLRPALVIGSAAETGNLGANARAKLTAKRADWNLANEVSPARAVMGGEENTIHLVTGSGTEDWPKMTKVEVARRLVARIGDALRESGRGSA